MSHNLLQKQLDELTRSHETLESQNSALENIEPIKSLLKSMQEALISFLMELTTTLSFDLDIDDMTKFLTEMDSNMENPSSVIQSCLKRILEKVISVISKTLGELKNEKEILMEDSRNKLEKLEQTKRELEEMKNKHCKEEGRSETGRNILKSLYR